MKDAAGRTAAGRTAAAVPQIDAAGDGAGLGGAAQSPWCSQIDGDGDGDGGVSAVQQIFFLEQ